MTAAFQSLYSNNGSEVLCKHIVFVLCAGHTSKRAREEPDDSEAEDMAVDPTALPAGFSGRAGFSGGVGAPASAAAAATELHSGAARKQARQQDATADGTEHAGEAGEAAEGALPPPQRGDCIVFVSSCTFTSATTCWQWPHDGCQQHVKPSVGFAWYPAVPGYATAVEAAESRSHRGCSPAECPAHIDTLLKVGSVNSVTS